MIDAPDAWATLAARIEAEGGTALLLGASDSGKTTLAQWLMRTLAAAGRRVAFLDGDIGQSTVGPPATVALALPTASSADSCLSPIALRFIGAVSPARQMLPLAVSLKRLADKAHALGAEVLLVDTTGLVLGPLGRRLKFHKIELLAPQHLIALQREEELEPILGLFDSRKGVVIHRFPVSPHVTPRSPQARRLYRAQRFSAHFQSSRLLELSLRDVVIQGAWLSGGRPLNLSELRGLSEDLHTAVLGGILGPDEAFLLVGGEPSLEGQPLARSRLGVPALSVVERDHTRGLLVGLADRENELLALGLIHELDFTSGRLVCRTPFDGRAQVRFVHTGTLRLDPSGEELGETELLTGVS